MDIIQQLRPIEQELDRLDAAHVLRVCELHGEGDGREWGVGAEIAFCAHGVDVVARDVGILRPGRGEDDGEGEGFACEPEVDVREGDGVDVEGLEAH